jgi:hypothetical protein
MAPLRSIAELTAIGIIFRAEETVAIVQQLIHNIPADDCRVKPPFGPPSPDSVLIDEAGLVTCRTCETTLGVSEVAIFLQQLLPAGTPRVPGALRYMIARALHDVDAPPFDSLEEFSAGLARFERGDRVAVIRAMVERMSSTALVHTQATYDDRRRRMPTASDFRRELRAADAQLYAQLQARRALPSAPPPSPPLPAPPPERRRTATIAAGVMAGLTLIAAGEVMHIRSTPASEVTASQTQPAPEPVAVPVANRKPAERDAPRLARPTKAADTVTAVSRDKSKSAGKPSVRRTSSTARPRDAKRAPGKMDRLHLGWLRNIVTVRTAPL